MRASGDDRFKVGMHRLALLLAACLLGSALAGCVNPLSPGDPTGPGALARDYLSNAKHSRLLVEIDHVAGSAPNTHATGLLQQRIAENTAKDGNVETRLEASVSGRGGGYKYSIDEIRALEDRHRGHFSGGDTAVLYVLYLDGGFARDPGETKTLAIAYRGSSIAVFKGNIRDSSVPDDTVLPTTKPREREVEQSVLVHEFGHIAGLVSNGIPMVTPREDSEHPGHTTHEGSVMYWAVETNAILTIFGLDDIPDAFDADDKADMQAARGG